MDEFISDKIVGRQPLAANAMALWVGMGMPTYNWLN